MIHRPTHPYLQALPREAGSPFSFYAAMLVIWHLRPATQRRFPLQKGEPRDILRYLAWCATDGRKDYAILREVPGWDEELNRPVNLPQLKGDRWTAAHSLGTFLYRVTVHRWSLRGIMKSSWARDLAARVTETTHQLCPCGRYMLCGNPLAMRTDWPVLSAKSGIAWCQTKS